MKHFQSIDQKRLSRSSSTLDSESLTMATKSASHIIGIGTDAGSSNMTPEQLLELDQHPDVVQATLDVLGGVSDSSYDVY